jgi:prolipoprotein diacylglyceryl transferase
VPAAPATILAAIPSPPRSVWYVGPVPVRAYALCIIAGIVAAILIAERRWVARGGRRGTVSDVAVWAVVFGLIGGRLYHVITDNELYFREGRDPLRALYIWEGGLGIWGAIALGGVGAWIGCRRRGIKLPPYADAAAPGIAVAQGIGRLGNWFNQELFGRPTDLPWGLEIDPGRPGTVAGVRTYHPTFLYEMIWCFALAGVLVLVDRRFKLGRGRVFALYVMGYTAGRFWIEMLRVDTANLIFGVRLNVWTSVVVFLGALVYFLLHRGPRETEVEPRAAAPDAAPSPAGADPGGAGSTVADASDSEQPGGGAQRGDDGAGSGASSDRDGAGGKADGGGTGDGRADEDPRARGARTEDGGDPDRARGGARPAAPSARD